MSKTVRVRIAVAVCPNGEWQARGDSTHTDEESKDIIYMCDLPTGETWHFIEADIPLPEPQTIEGEVVA